MPVTTGFNHVAFLSTDLDRTRAFYESAFDAVLTFEMAAKEDHPRMVILDVGGGAFLNVFEVEAETIIGERRRIGRRGAVDHFAFAVDTAATLEAVRERLTAAGAQEVGEVHQLGDELSLFFRDCDGLELEVCSPLAE